MKKIFSSTIFPLFLFLSLFFLFGSSHKADAAYGTMTFANNVVTLNASIYQDDLNSAYNPCGSYNGVTFTPNVPTSWQFEVNAFDTSGHYLNQTVGVLPLSTRSQQVSVDLSQALANGETRIFVYLDILGQDGSVCYHPEAFDYSQEPFDLNNFPQSLTFGTQKDPSINAAPAVSPVGYRSMHVGGIYQSTSSIFDPDSSSWTVTVDYGDGSGVQPVSLNGNMFSLNHQYNSVGDFPVTVTITDDSGNSTVLSAVVTTVYPVYFTCDSSSYTVGSPTSDSIVTCNGVSVNGTHIPYSTSAYYILSYDFANGLHPEYNDCDDNDRLTRGPNNTLNLRTDYIYQCLPTSPLTLFLYNTQNNLTYIAEKDFPISDATQVTPTPTPANNPPQISTLSGETINEGSVYTENASFTDADSTSWTAMVDYGDGSGTQPLSLNGTTFSLSHTYQDNGAYIVTVSVTDNQGATAKTTTTVTVNNVAPTVGTITAPSAPTQVNTSITASASFTDPGILDTHTASWNWGDGNTSVGTVTESNGSGSISDSHTYTTPGVYTITLTITDKDGGSGTGNYQYVVIYDTTTKSVSSSKEFTSPAGAVTASPSVTGKANFGFTAKYDNNGNVIPIGNNWASLNFKQGSTIINFVATSYQWLVVNGGEAVLKGSGKLNNTSGYTVLISAIDGNLSGGADMVRYQIKDSSNNVVYDTQQGASDTANPTTAVTKGKITIK